MPAVGRGKKQPVITDNVEQISNKGRGTKRPRDTENEEKVSKKKKISHRSHRNSDDGGVVLVFGQGDVGQLGLGEDIMERGRPALLKDIEDVVVQACAGGMHTVCLTSKGEVYTFGCNDEGALGRDTSEEGSETLPGKVDLAANIVQISAGDGHSAALTDDGQVFAWGNFRDANGSIGLTVAGIQHKPLRLLDDTIIKIVSGGDHLVCLTDGGEIYTCGCAEQGQLGRVAECFATRGGRKGLDFILTPSKVRCMRHKTRKRAKFSDIWAGQFVTFAQENETGEIYGWGLNNYFQLGFNDMESRFAPERISKLCGKNFVAIQGGQHHTIALDANGKVYSFGRAEYGRLGLGKEAKETATPTLVSGVTQDCIAVSAGQSVSFACAKDGTVFSWGMGTSLQLGTAQEDDEFEPVKVAGKQLETRSVLAVSGGGQHTVLLAKNKV